MNHLNWNESYKLECYILKLKIQILVNNFTKCGIRWNDFIYGKASVLH